MIRTNSELPITLLKDYNEKLNDFDLVLFHLYTSEPEYKRYFDNMRKEHPERTMILDNSAYEFFIKGEELNLDKYTEAIIELKPNYYILPDVLMNRERTISNILDFSNSRQAMIESSSEIAPQPIAVVQGNTIDDFNMCLITLLNMGYTNIAIPFHNSFFKDEFNRCDYDIAQEFTAAGYNYHTEDVRYAMGRCMWMKYYGVNLLIPNDEPHYTMLHFLGSHCPAEKKYLKSLFFSECNVSMDTGYPVKLAIDGKILGEEDAKPKTIIDDFMLNDFSTYERKMIEDNINIFRNY